MCETAKVKKAIIAFRGYALEGKGPNIGENKIIHEWCEAHTEEDLRLVIEELEKDPYWQKTVNREHFYASDFQKETPKLLNRRRPIPLHDTNRQPARRISSFDDPDYHGFEDEFYPASNDFRTIAR